MFLHISPAPPPGSLPGSSLNSAGSSRSAFLEEGVLVPPSVFPRLQFLCLTVPTPPPRGPLSQLSASLYFFFLVSFFGCCLLLIYCFYTVSYWSGSQVG